MITRHSLLCLCPSTETQQHVKTQGVIMQTGKAAQRFGLLVEELSVCVKGITELQISYGITDSGANFGKSQDFPEKLLNRKK